MRLYCSDIVPDSKPGWTTSICCSSCHIDADEGQDDLIEIEFRGQEAVVCCAVARWIHEAGEAPNEESA